MTSSLTIWTCSSQSWQFVFVPVSTRLLKHVPDHLVARCDTADPMSRMPDPSQVRWSWLETWPLTKSPLPDAILHAKIKDRKQGLAKWNKCWKQTIPAEPGMALAVSPTNGAYAAASSSTNLWDDITENEFSFRLQAILGLERMHTLQCCFQVLQAHGASLWYLNWSTLWWSWISDEYMIITLTCVSDYISDREPTAIGSSPTSYPPIFLHERQIYFIVVIDIVPTGELLPWGLASHMEEHWRGPCRKHPRGQREPLQDSRPRLSEVAPAMQLWARVWPLFKFPFTS